MRRATASRKSGLGKGSEFAGSGFDRVVVLPASTWRSRLVVIQFYGNRIPLSSILSKTVLRVAKADAKSPAKIKFVVTTPSLFISALKACTACMELSALKAFRNPARTSIASCSVILHGFLLNC